MPTALEEKLRHEAREKFPIPENASEEEKKRIEQRRNAYVFGTMRNQGWKPKRDEV